MADLDWRQIYDRELPRIYNFFRYQIADVMVVEDLTAITFKRAWEYRDSYQEDLAAFSTWLITIARRVAIDHFRRTASLKEVELTPAYDLKEDLSLEAVIEQRNQFEAVRQLIRQLSDREQELIALRYGVEMSYNEIAELLGLNPTNVGVILHRAIRKLRLQLASEVSNGSVS